MSKLKKESSMKQHCKTKIYTSESPRVKFVQVLRDQNLACAMIRIRSICESLFVNMQPELHSFIETFGL